MPAAGAVLLLVDPSAALLSLHSSVVAGMCHGCWVVQMSLPAERQADAADSYCRCLPARPCLQAKAKAYMQAVMEHKRCVPFLRYNGEHRWATAALAWLLSWCLHAAPCSATAAVPAMPAAVPAARQTTYFAGAAWCLRRCGNQSGSATAQPQRSAQLGAWGGSGSSGAGEARPAAWQAMAVDQWHARRLDPALLSGEPANLQPGWQW